MNARVMFPNCVSQALSAIFFAFGYKRAGTGNARRPPRVTLLTGASHAFNNVLGYNQASFGSSADARGRVLALLGEVSADGFKDCSVSRTNAGTITLSIIFLTKDSI